jgi:cyclase
MLRRSTLPILSVLLAALLAAAATEQEDTRVETRAVRGQVSYLVGAGGNVGVMVGKDGVLLVDDKFARHAAAIDGALKALGGGAPEWLVNTHWHGDHTGGNEHFGATATIFAQTNVRRRLAGDKQAVGGRVAEPPAAPAALPAVTYEDGIVLHVNGEDVRVMHLGPGHTDGDSVVFFQGSNVVHMGDLFFNIGYPFIDLASGGDVEGVIKSCKQVIELVPADAAVIPGHGDATDVAGLKTYVAMLEECLARVRKAHAEGKTAEQMVGAGLLSDFNARWGKFDFVTPEKWIGTLAEYVAR